MDYYEFLKKTARTAEKLMDRLVYLEEPSLAQNAQLLLGQLRQLIANQVDGQILAIQSGDFSG